ncbi:MAG: 5-formyltetrahydrofolate cyclo-ligase, partial [Candidatus Diapherotrites archaeon]
MTKEKKYYRTTIKKERQKIRKTQVEKLSNKIIQKLKKLPEIKKAKKIAIYLDYNNEVKTRKLKKWLLEQGKKVYVPKMTTNGIVFVQIKEKTQFKKNKVGIKEPKKGRKTNPKKIELFIIPGIAFTKDLHRIGSGKGYYDKFFSKHKIKAKKIAIAYDFQIIKKIKKENHDIRMDMIITD